MTSDQVVVVFHSDEIVELAMIEVRSVHTASPFRMVDHAGCRCEVPVTVGAGRVLSAVGPGIEMLHDGEQTQPMMNTIWLCVGKLTCLILLRPLNVLSQSSQ